jgi:hypothetical protein
MRAARNPLAERDRATLFKRFHFLWRSTMNRKVIAGLFALAALPATALTANAADPSSAFTRTVPMGCRLNASDGESLKVRMMLTNTSGYHLSEGSKVRIGIRYATFPHGPRRTVYLDQTLWRDVPVSSAIGFDQPTNRGRAISCAATVTFASKAKLDRVTQPKSGPIKIQ